MKTVFVVSVLWAIPQVFSCLDRKGFGPGLQDWGYEKVRPGAFMFWWLYETTANTTLKTDRPLAIWLQGGPSSSSTGYGNFEEIGPLDTNLNLRNYTWVNNFNVLFVDSPVGTGFSYVDADSALTTTNKEIAVDLVACLEGFYEKRPEFIRAPLFITGESYGGKMIVEFAVELVKKIKSGGIRSDLRGITLIDPWISPIDSVLTWAPYLYYLGVVDRQGYNKIDSAAQKLKATMEDGNFKLAAEKWHEAQELVSNVTFNVDWYNVLKKIPLNSSKDSRDLELTRLMNGPVKKSLNLNVTWAKRNISVFSAQAGDFMKPVTNLVEQLLETTDIKIQVVNGQLDLIVDVAGTLSWVDRLQWSKSEEWKQTPRTALEYEGMNEGYKKVVQNFALYWVDRAGHMVPRDNPAAMQAILNDLMGTFT